MTDYDIEAFMSIIVCELIILKKLLKQHDIDITEQTKEAIKDSRQILDQLTVLR